jgi:hypothetical protein
MAGTEMAEEICTLPDRGQMTCMLRLMSAAKVDGLEFITFRESSGGVEERTRFFSGEFGETPGDDRATMRLTSVTESKIVLDNAKTNGEVKRITITRRGKDAFSSHIDLVGADGKAGVIDSEWKRGR